jgi:hypothetical protein
MSVITLGRTSISKFGIVPTRVRRQEQVERERLVSLSNQMCELLDDWLSNKQPAVTDSQGREPLLTSNKRRLTKSTIRRYVYHWTCPWVIGSDCPHDRELEDCEARERGKFSKCPSSVSPHAVVGSITQSLNSDWPETAVSGRPNVRKRYYAVITSLGLREKVWRKAEDIWIIIKISNI